MARNIDPVESIAQEKLEILMDEDIHHIGPQPQIYGGVCRTKYRNLWREAWLKDLQGLVSNITFTVVDVSARRKSVEVNE